MNNMLDDIEKVVDDFCLEEKKEKKWSFEDFENEMLIKRLDMVIEQQHQEAARRSELELERQYHESLKNYTSNGHIRENSIRCSCGRRIDIVYRENIRMPLSASLSDNTYYDFEHDRNYIRFFCGFCGRDCALDGSKLIAIKNY